MKAEDQNPLDRLFREKLKDRSFEFEEAAWDDALELIEENQGGGNKRWWAVGLVALLLIGSVAIWNTVDTNTEVAQVSENTGTENNATPESREKISDSQDDEQYDSQVSEIEPLASDDEVDSESIDLQDPTSRFENSTANTSSGQSNGGTSIPSASKEHQRPEEVRTENNSSSTDIERNGQESAEDAVDVRNTITVSNGSSGDESLTNKEEVSASGLIEEGATPSSNSSDLELDNTDAVDSSVGLVNGTDDSASASSNGDLADQAEGSPSDDQDSVELNSNASDSESIAGESVVTNDPSNSSTQVDEESGQYFDPAQVASVADTTMTDIEEVALELATDSLTVYSVLADSSAPALNLPEQFEPNAYFHLFTGVGQGYSSIRGLEAATMINEGSTPELAPSAGFTYFQKFGKVYVGTGLQFDRINNSVNYQERDFSKLDVRIVYNFTDTMVFIPDSNAVQGGYWGDVTILTSTTFDTTIEQRTREFASTNIIRSYISIPLLVAYHKRYNNWGIGLTAGPRISYLIGQKGLYPSHDVLGYEELPTDYFRRVQLGYMIRPTAQYHFSDILSVGLEPFMQGQVSTSAKTGVLENERFTTFGVGFGLTYWLSGSRTTE